MNKNLLKGDETLFRDPDVFGLSYVPEQFDYRDEQTEALAFSIRPGLRGGRILDSVCCGPPATGKTTSVKKIFDLLEETTDRIIPVHVNCKVDSTEYAVFSRIYTSLTKQRTPLSGTSRKQIMDQIARYIQTQRIQLLLCLDDANYLIYQKEFINVIYPLVRVHEVYPEVNIGIILIISDPAVDVMESLDVLTRSTFHPDVIEYPPYTVQEIAGILNARVIAGLFPNVLSPAHLDRIVDTCMQYGDVRLGLAIIRRAVMLAEHDARKTVTDADVEKVLDSLLNIHLLERMKPLSADERLVLAEIVELSETKDKISTKEVGQVFLPTGPKRTRMAAIFTRLSDVGLVDLEYANTGGGRRRYVRLHGARTDFVRCLAALAPQDEEK